MKTFAGEEGCRKSSTHINIITRQGNSSTRPSGIETVELPFNRILLLKNPEGTLGVMRSAFSDQVEGKGGGEGMRFVRFCAKPIGAVNASRARQATPCAVLPPDRASLVTSQCDPSILRSCGAGAEVGQVG